MNETPRQTNLLNQVPDSISSHAEPQLSSDTSDTASVSSEDSDFEPYFKKKKDDEVVLKVDKNALKKSSLQSDVDGVSIRNQLRYTSTFIQSCGGSIDNVSLSRTSLDRFRKEARQQKATDI